MYQVIKRDGQIADFDIAKISSAITKAFEANNKEYNPNIIDLLALRVTADFELNVQRHILNFEFSAVYLLNITTH